MFVATQVARAAGLKDPHNQVSLAAAKLGALRVASIGNLPRDGRIVKANSWLFTEASLYQMLLRGHAPASEPFRKWVTEEVLPTIRKTGKYDLEESTSDFAKELQAFRLRFEEQDKVIATQAKEIAELIPLRGQVESLRELIEATAKSAAA